MMLSGSCGAGGGKVSQLSRSASLPATVPKHGRVCSRLNACAQLLSGEGTRAGPNTLSPDATTVVLTLGGPWPAKAGMTHGVCASQSLLSPGTKAAPCLHFFPTPTQGFTGERLQVIVAPLEAGSAVCSVGHRPFHSRRGLPCRSTIGLRDMEPMRAGTPLKESLTESCPGRKPN